MIVVVMLSLAGLSFVVLLSTENKAVHARGAELQVESVVGSGEEAIKAALAESFADPAAAEGFWDNADRFCGVLVLEDEPTGRRGRFSVISPKIEDGEITGTRFGVENESARLNLAVLPRWEQRQSGAARRALMSLPGMTEQTADAILDWIDADSAPRQFGAEADYYKNLGVPYVPRNAVPVCLEELLLVKGVTREMLFGADANFNHQFDRRELRRAGDRPRSGWGGSDLPWASLLTVHSAERNLTPEGKPRINLNGNNLEELYRQLNAVFDEHRARFIIAYRQFGPYEGSRRPGPDPVGRIDFSLPGKVKIATVLDLLGVKVQVPCAGRKEPVFPENPFGNGDGDGNGNGDGESIILENPFGDGALGDGDDPIAMCRELPKLLDYVSVLGDRVIPGRINVNLASRDVLRGVPTMDEAIVQRIVASRGGQTVEGDPVEGNPVEGNADRRHATWLLTEGLVDLDQMKALMPYLTGGGDVFRAQVVGYFDTPGPTARVEVVLDATTTPPRRVYWKDLRLLGLGYPRETLIPPTLRSTGR
jgi:DNA uptake protein ComE-like DNA-binding protein